jgi:hypothetical protein
LSTKRHRQPDGEELKKTVDQIQVADRTVKVDTTRTSVVLCNDSPEDARWGDVLKGDESGNAATVDLGKLQMFFFTFVLVLSYGVAVARLFQGAQAIAELPEVDGSMNTLLGISHTGYLANKTVSHSREGESPT